MRNYIRIGGVAFCLAATTALTAPAFANCTIAAGALSPAQLRQIADFGCASLMKTDGVAGQQSASTGPGTGPGTGGPGTG